MNPEVDSKRYQLYVEKESSLDKGRFFFTPVGLPELTIEKARSWLSADFNIYKQFPNIKYKIVETVYFKQITGDVETGNR